MPKFYENDVYQLNQLSDPRDIAAPFSYDSDVAVTVTYGSVNIDGTNCANVDVYYRDGRVEKRLERYSDIIAGKFDRPKASDDDDDIGYHNLRATDL